MAAGDTAGAVKAFSLALETGDASDIAGRLHRRTAQALLMQHDAEQAESHLRAAEALSEDPAERARLVCLRATQAWERGERLIERPHRRPELASLPTIRRVARAAVTGSTTR